MEAGEQQVGEAQIGAPPVGGAPGTGFDFMLAAAADAPSPWSAMDAEPTSSGQQGILNLGIQVPAAVSRRSPLDGIALALALLVAPLGLLLGIVAAALGVRRLGYASGLAKAAIVVALVLSLVLAGGGVAYSFVARSQAYEAALRTESQPMCRLISAEPGVLADPAFGWPALDSTIPAYADAVARYAKWWQQLSAAAPAAVKKQVQALATVAARSQERMAVSKVVERDQDYADLQKAAAASTLPAWVKTYC